MKILWFSNCDLSISNVSTTGSWLYAMSAILTEHGVKICNVTEDSVKSLVKNELNGIIQYVVPYSKIKNGLPSHTIIQMLQSIEDSESPDLIHIWGMESYWGIMAARGLFRAPRILEIQGIKYACQRVYSANLTLNDMLRCFRLKEWIAYNRSIPYCKWQLQKWVKFEKEMLSRHKYISTQSDWVRAHIAPYIGKDSIVLSTKMAVREQFMDINNIWQGAGSHDILVMASGPIPYKGVHDAIRAISLVKDSYPDVKLKIIGNMGHDVPIWKKGGYTKYLQELIIENSLTENVIFTGSLNAEEIVREMKMAGVMAIPSYVETYCLAMAEAMATGLPCVASYSGALPELAINEESALFFDAGDYEMMAHQICRMFNDIIFAQKISNNSRDTAAKRNDKNAVCERQLEIYNDVLKYVDSNSN